MMIRDESVLNVLMYLFKHHMHENCELDMLQPKLLTQLEEQGFRRKVIDRAFTWIDNLTRGTREPIQLPHRGSLRVFSDYECELLDVECRSFILTLEQQGILNAHTRELAINQALELEPEGIDISLFKWVTLLVLFNQPDEKHALACMEMLVLDETIGGIH